MIYPIKTIKTFSCGVVLGMHKASRLLCVLQEQGLWNLGLDQVVTITPEIKSKKRSLKCHGVTISNSQRGGKGGYFEPSTPIPPLSKSYERLCMRDPLSYDFETQVLPSIPLYLCTVRACLVQVLQGVEWFEKDIKCHHTTRLFYGSEALFTTFLLSFSSLVLKNMALVRLFFQLANQINGRGHWKCPSVFLWFVKCADSVE